MLPWISITFDTELIAALIYINCRTFYWGNTLMLNKAPFVMTEYTIITFFDLNISSDQRMFIYSYTMFIYSYTNTSHPFPIGVGEDCSHQLTTILPHITHFRRWRISWRGLSLGYPLFDMVCLPPPLPAYLLFYLINLLPLSLTIHISFLTINKFHGNLWMYICSTRLLIRSLVATLSIFLFFFFQSWK